jgi:hypothetical protein
MWQCADCDHDGFVDMTELDAFLKKCCGEELGLPEDC